MPDGPQDNTTKQISREAASDILGQAQNELARDLDQNLTQTEIDNLFKDVQERGLPPGSVRQVRFMRDALNAKLRERENIERAGLENPDVQELIAEGQLPEGSRADFKDPSAGDVAPEEGIIPAQTQLRASKFFGGQGAPVTPEGREIAIKEIFGPGTEVQQVILPKNATENIVGELVKVPGSDVFRPFNPAGPDSTDLFGIAGDLASLEVGLSVVPFTKPFRALAGLSKVPGVKQAAALAAAGAGLGAGIEAGTNEDVELQKSIIATRVALNMGLAGASEALMRGVVAPGINFLRGTGGGAEGRVSRSAQEQVGEINQLIDDLSAETGQPLAPLGAGEASSSTLAKGLMNRLGAFTPGILKKIVQRRHDLGNITAEKIYGMESVNRNIEVSGLSDVDLQKATELVREDLQADIRQEILGLKPSSKKSRSPEQAQESISRALTDVGTTLPSGTKRESFRTLANERMQRLFQDVVDEAEGKSFTIDLTDAITLAEELKGRTPVPSKAASSGALSPEELSQGGENFSIIGRELNRSFTKQLNDVLDTLVDLPGGKLKNGQVIRIQGKGEAPDKFGETDALGIISMLRTKLSDFYGDPLVRGGPEAGEAKRLDTALRNSLRNIEGSEVLSRKINRYNASTSRNLQLLDEFEGLNNLTGKGREGGNLVNSFTQGQIGARQAQRVIRALKIQGERGERALQQLKGDITDQFVRFPDRIKNLVEGPNRAALELMFNKNERALLRGYQTAHDVFRSRGLDRLAAEAGGMAEKSKRMFDGMSPTNLLSFVRRTTNNQVRIMKTGLMVDVLERSLADELGTPGLFSPKKFTNNISELLRGDTGRKFRTIFSEEEVEGLLNLEKLNTHFASVLGNVGDVGASINRSQLAGAPLEQAVTANIPRAFMSVLKNKFLVLAGNSLADGILSKTLTPLKTPAGEGRAFNTIRQSLVSLAQTIDFMTKAGQPEAEDKLLKDFEKAKKDILRNPQVKRLITNPNALRGQ